MHPVAARISAHTAERIDMRWHILFEHGFCKQSRLIFIAGGSVCARERQNNGFQIFIFEQVTSSFLKIKLKSTKIWSIIIIDNKVK